jgi:hypothetical protein
MSKAIFGLIVLTGVAIAAPAMAQSVYMDGGGVSIGVGERHHRDGVRRHHRHNGAVVIRERDSYAAARCKTTKVIRSDGSSKTIRKCM